MQDEGYVWNCFDSQLITSKLDFIIISFSNKFIICVIDLDYETITFPKKKKEKKKSVYTFDKLILNVRCANTITKMSTFYLTNGIFI